jgi:hypothetical protein
MMSTRAITTAAAKRDTATGMVTAVVAVNTADTVIAAVGKAMGDAFTGVLPRGQNASPG